MLTIYGRPNSSNVRKVLWFAGEIDLPYERLDYGRGFAATDTPEYLAMNPNGLVPTVTDGDTVIWESNAILRYLANKHGKTDWYPEDVSRRAVVEQWMDWQLSVLNMGMQALFQGGHLDMPPFNSPERLETGYAMTSTAVRILGEQIEKAGGAFITGPTITLADCAIGMYVHRWYQLDVERESLPALDAYYARLKERPAYDEFIVQAGV